MPKVRYGYRRFVPILRDRDSVIVAVWGTRDGVRVSWGDREYELTAAAARLLAGKLRRAADESDDINRTKEN